MSYNVFRLPDRKLINCNTDIETFFSFVGNERIRLVLTLYIFVHKTNHIICIHIFSVVLVINANGFHIIYSWNITSTLIFFSFFFTRRVYKRYITYRRAIPTRGDIIKKKKINFRRQFHKIVTFSDNVCRREATVYMCVVQYSINDTTR